MRHDEAARWRLCLSLCLALISAADAAKPNVLLIMSDDLAASRAQWELLYLDAVDHATPKAAVEAVVDVVRGRRSRSGTGA